MNKKPYVSKALKQICFKEEQITLNSNTILPVWALVNPMD